MKRTYFLVACILAGGIISAQKKYEKMVYKEVSVDSGYVTLAAKDLVSTKDFTKFKFILNNKSDKILIYKPDESLLKLEDGKEFTSAEKWLILSPTESGSRVINYKGPDFMVSNYQFLVNGIYKISETEKPVKAPVFLLPPSTNTFKAGPFNCTMLSLSKETDKTTVKFECQYTGDKYGIINPGRAAVKLPDSTEIANAKSKSKSEVLATGQTERFTLVWNRMEGGKTTDMQLIKMQILWRNTFVEAVPVKVTPIPLKMVLDEAASK